MVTTLKSEDAQTKVITAINPLKEVGSIRLRFNQLTSFFSWYLHHSEIHFQLEKVKVEAKIFKMDKPSELKA